MMKMDSFGGHHGAAGAGTTTTSAPAPPSEFATDFSAIFDKICNMTLSPQSHQSNQSPPHQEHHLQHHHQPQSQQSQQQYYQHYHHPSPPVVVTSSSTSSSSRKNSNGFQKKGNSVSPRPFKRGESQPNAIGTSSAAASQRRLRFREFSQVGLAYF